MASAAGQAQALGRGRFLGLQSSLAAPRGALKVVRWLGEALAALAARRSLSVLCQDDSVPGGPGTTHGWEDNMGLNMIKVSSPPEMFSSALLKRCSAEFLPNSASP